jgi:signal transduction histidine kinase
MRQMRRAWLMATWLLCLGLSPASAQQAVPRSILILDESAGAAAGPFYAGIVSALRASVNRDPSNQYSIYVEHLDLSRFRGPSYELGLNRFFSTKYKERPVGVIVAVGTGALEYILRSRGELWPAVPVVFTFVNPLSANALQLPADVTGTTFRLKFSDMIAAARVAVPDLIGVAVVGDAIDTLVAYRHFKDEIPVVAATGMQIIDLMGMPIREVRARVANLPARTAIVYTVMYSDGEGTYLTPVEALGRFADAANRPIVVTAETQIGQGAIGGFIASPSALGQAAAVPVLRTFQGETAATIPVNEGNFVKPVFDWRQLRRWDVSESQLPPGSEIRFRQLSAWDQYRWQIVAIATAVLLQTGLIHWLLYERRRRRVSEMVTRDALSELAHVNRLATGNELSASIAHEVMQPLTGIVSSANAGLRWLSAATPDVDKARAMLTQIVAAGHRAAEVVRAIRAMFKKSTDNDQPVEMSGLILATLDLVRRDLEEHNVAVETGLEERLPVLRADTVQMQQVLLNLIVNAIDAMTTSSSGERILSVRSEVRDGCICVSVADNGPGVSEEMLDKIFTPLFTTKAQGMGLGLSICRSIVEAHHGRIWASLHQPRGVIIHISLPIERPEP